jgi:hypothetical protein
MGPGIRVDPTRTREAEILAGSPSGDGKSPGSEEEAAEESAPVATEAGS